MAWFGTSWIVEVTARGTRVGKPFHATHLFRERGNGTGVMATLRTAALNLLRLTDFRSIRTGLQAVMHDIKALLAIARRQPESTPG